jgi:hypothetical protein
MDETDYLLSTEANRNHLFRSMQELKEGKVTAMTLAQLQDRYRPENFKKVPKSKRWTR